MADKNCHTKRSGREELKFDLEIHIQEINFDGTTLDRQVSEIVIYLMEHMDYLHKDRNWRVYRTASHSHLVWSAFQYFISKYQLEGCYKS